MKLNTVSVARIGVGLVVLCLTPWSNADWFLGEWVNDANETLKTNSYYGQQGKRTHEFFHSMDGAMQWHIRSKSLTITHEGMRPQLIPMSVKPDSEDTVQLSNPHYKMNIIIFRTKIGLCAIPATTVDGLPDTRLLECFRKKTEA